MKVIKYTLLADGSSDAVLMPIINWLIEQHRPDLSILPQFAKNIGNVGLNLSARVPIALKFYPCELLFIHRDAEQFAHADRLQEIANALNNINKSYIPIIPIRMTEAWLLSDENAIRAAAGNKSSTVNLDLPNKRNWEAHPNPKQLLFNALIAASEKTGRALKKFSPEKQRARVTELTPNFAPLRGLASFDSFENELIKQLKHF